MLKPRRMQRCNMEQVEPNSIVYVQANIKPGIRKTDRKQIFSELVQFYRDITTARYEKTIEGLEDIHSVFQKTVLDSLMQGLPNEFISKVNEYIGSYGFVSGGYSLGILTHWRSPEDVTSFDKGNMHKAFQAYASEKAEQNLMNFIVIQYLNGEVKHRKIP